MNMKYIHVYRFIVWCTLFIYASYHAFGVLSLIRARCIFPRGIVSRMRKHLWCFPEHRDIGNVGLDGELVPVEDAYVARGCITFCSPVAPNEEDIK